MRISNYLYLVDPMSHRGYIRKSIGAQDVEGRQGFARVMLFIDTGHKQIAFETVKNSIFR